MRSRIRPFTEAEVDELKSRLKPVWGWTGHYFHPLDGTKRPDFLTFPEDLFLESVDKSHIARILKAMGVKTINLICEYYESETGEFQVDDLFLPVGDSFVFDPSMTWMIFTSHSNSITFCGPGLIERIKQALPDWESVSKVPWG